LTKMMDEASSWCGSGCELREIPREYVVERRSIENTLNRPTLHAPNAPRS
jgi:hypothetical protein